MATALIIVDVQHDFLPGGALGIQYGDEVIRPIQAIADSFDCIVKTRDAHPADTPHFNQWPVHCVDGTDGAELHPAIAELDGRVFDKGTGEGDGYSGFDNPQLREWLTERGITTVLVVGLALDYCVKATALDAQRAGFRTAVKLSCTRAVDPQGSPAVRADLERAGVVVYP